MSRIALATIAACLPVIGQIRIDSVVSAASFEPGVPEKLSLASIYCTGLTGIDELKQAPGFPLPRELAGVTVVVGGAVAPLLALAPIPGGQQVINFQVPLEATFETGGAITVTLRQGGSSTSSVQNMRVPVGDFFRLPDAPSSALLRHGVDGRLVTPENPAQPGEVLTGYLTNVLWKSVEVPKGSAAPVPPPQVPGFPSDPHLVAVGRMGSAIFDYSKVLFFGMLSGVAGVFEIRFRLPERINWTPGQPPVVILMERVACVPFPGLGCSQAPRHRGSPAILPVEPLNQAFESVRLAVSFVLEDM